MREWLVRKDQREAVLGARYRRDHLLDVHLSSLRDAADEADPGGPVLSSDGVS